MTPRPPALWVPGDGRLDEFPEALLGRFLPESMTEPEMRIALVESVHRLNPHDLDEGLLLCDRAAAALAAGQRERAAELLSSTDARDALAQLADQVLGSAELDLAHLEAHRTSSRLSSGLDDVARLADLAAQLPDGADFARLAAELRIDQRLRRHGTFESLATPLSRWIEAPGVGTYKAGGGTLRHRVDLRAVPPRVLAWRGADVAEIETIPVSGGTLATIPMRHGRGGDAQLRLFIASLEGRLLADVPLVSAADRLTARVDDIGVPLRATFVGVHSENLDPAALAQRAAGPAVDAERLLIESWTAARFGLAAAVALEADHGDRSRDEEPSDDPEFIHRWMQTPPTARASAAAARETALAAGDDDPRIDTLTFRNYADQRAWDLRTASSGPGRPLLSELEHVLQGGGK